MCINIYASASMSIIGIIATFIIYNKTNFLIALGIFYFTLMEIIQTIGYSVIDKCDNILNKTISYLNYIHISFQPFFYTLFIFALLRYYRLSYKLKNVDLVKMVLSLAFVASIFSFLRLFGEKTDPNCYLCGEKACVKSGKYHLRIETPLRTEPEYLTPNLFIHFFFFFIPPLFLGKFGIIVSVFMFATFIALVKGLKIDAEEGSTTWCFISIMQLVTVIIFGWYFSKKK